MLHGLVSSSDWIWTLLGCWYHLFEPRNVQDSRLFWRKGKDIVDESLNSPCILDSSIQLLKLFWSDVFHFSPFRIYERDEADWQCLFHYRFLNWLQKRHPSSTLTLRRKHCNSFSWFCADNVALRSLLHQFSTVATSACHQLTESPACINIDREYYKATWIM